MPVTDRKISQGFTLVELIIAIAMMGGLVLMVSTLAVKSLATTSSLNTRYAETLQVHSLILDIQKDLYRGVYISNNSHQKRLEYTTYDDAGNTVKKIYGICYSTFNASSTDTTCPSASGSNTVPYLKISRDGGSTWVSPYRVEPYNKYFLTGSPAFLFAQDDNNCTRFTDTDGNGVWNGSDSAGSSANCGTYTNTTTILNNPSQSTKVILSSFQFSSVTGNPLVSRNLPSNIFMSAPQGPVISPLIGISPAVKDSSLINSFITNTDAMRFGTAFDIRGLTWDSARQRLIVVGHHNSGACKIFQVDRTGVLIGPGLSIKDTTVQLDDVALLSDGQSVIALDDNSKIVYWYNLSGATPLIPYQSFNLGNITSSTPSFPSWTNANLVNSPSGILYDPNYPDEFFVVGKDPSDSTYKIFEINPKSTTTTTLASNAISGGKLALPSAFTASTPPSALSQEPISGDFLVPENYVLSAGGNHIDVYRITSSGISSSFSLNVTDTGSSATAATGNWGFAYSPETNHVFLTDTATDQVSEVIPPVLISPQN